MTTTPSQKTLILDLGDVLFTWSSTTKTCISPAMMHQMLKTPTWNDFERGTLSQETCYARVSEEFSIPVSEIEQAFKEARESLTANEPFILEIHRLKTLYGSRLRVLAMSNISREDYVYLRTVAADWSIFDEVYTSWEAGMRKPSTEFYEHVLARAGISPTTAIFVDDKLENVDAARALGIEGIVFDDTEHVVQSLRASLDSPIARGRDYLLKNAGQHVSVLTKTNMEVWENFAQLLILEATNNEELIKVHRHQKTWNFFIGQPIGTSKVFPDDFDTTALAWTVMPGAPADAHSIIDKIISLSNKEGIITTYFDGARQRIDPIVCINVLNFSYYYEYPHREHLARSQEYVISVLKHRAYLEGTRYYSSADGFLFFLSRLLSNPHAITLRKSLLPMLRQRIEERIEAPADAIALSQRILAGLGAGLRPELFDGDIETLKGYQCEDGGWEAGKLFRYGGSDLELGNRGVTTALAIKAIALTA